MGIPVVSSLTGGSAEVVHNGQNAVAFCAGNVEDLAQKLAWILMHPTEAAAMGLAASAEITEHYTLESEVEAVEGYLVELLGTR